MKKTIKVIPFSSILLILIGIFPFGLGAISAAKNYFLHKDPFPLIITVLAFLVIGFLLPSSRKPNLTIKIIILLSIFFLAVASRYILINTLQTTPTSDFAWVLMNAPRFIGQFYPNKYVINNPHWGIYTLTVAVIFSHLLNLLTGIQILNMILAGFTAIGIYLLGKKVFDSEKIGLLSSIIYILYPADLLYKSLPTGDHIFIAVLPYIFLLFFNALQSDPISKRNHFLFLIIGLLAGFVDLYKPVGMVLIIAMAIVILISLPKLLVNKFSGIIAIFILIVGFITIRGLGSSILEYRTGLEIQPTYFFRSIRIGLDIQNNGMWNDQTSRNIEKTIIENDARTADKILLDETLNNIFANFSDLPAFFYKKFDYVWMSDYDFHFWTAQNREQIDSLAINNFIERDLLIFVDAYHLFLLVFSFIGVIFAGISKKTNPTYVAISLFVFGIAILLLIMEVQQRYRGIIMSVLPILAAYGIYAVEEFIIRQKPKKLSLESK